MEAFVDTWSALGRMVYMVCQCVPCRSSCDIMGAFCLPGRSLPAALQGEEQPADCFLTDGHGPLVCRARCL